MISFSEKYSSTGWLNGSGCRRIPLDHPPKPDPWQKPSLLTQMSVSLNGNLWWQMQGMFQPRMLDEAFLLLCLFSVTDTRVLGLPDHSNIPRDLACCNAHWGCSLTADFHWVQGCAALQPYVSAGSAPLAAFLVMSPCCWAGSDFFECSSISSSWREQVINNAH